MLFTALLSWSEDSVIVVFVFFVVHDFVADGVGCVYDVHNGGGGSVGGGGGGDDDDDYDSEEDERWGSCFWEIE